MKPRTFLLEAALFAAIAVSIITTQAAPLTTLRNSTLSVPAASVASTGIPGSTNLTGTNFMLSAITPTTLHGGRVSLVNSQQWVTRYNDGPMSSQNAAYAIVVRFDGSIVVTGNSVGLTTDYDFVTISYAPDGTALWTNRYDGPAHAIDTASLLATDGNGNVWVAGDSMRNATNWSLMDTVVVKYASNGSPVRTNRYTNFDTNFAEPVALAVDGSGNAYVQQSLTYWDSTGSGFPVEFALTKYDPLGNADWINYYPASAPDSGQDLHEPGPMALDKAGNLFVAGTAGSEYYKTGNSIVKYAGNGTELWTNHQSYLLISTIDLLSVDPQGNVILTSDYWTNSTLVYTIMKCSNDGVSLWTNALSGPGYEGGNVPRTLPDQAGNVFVIGGSPNATLNSYGAPGLYQILKLSSNGVPLWTNLNVNFGATNVDIESSAVDSAGNLYLTGFAPAPAKTNDDYVTIKFSGDGLPIWTNRFDGGAGLKSIPIAMAVDGAGSVYVTGESERSPGNFDLTTVKYADQLFYTPPKDFTGSDTISYTITDNFGNSATGSVVVLVTPGAFQFNLTPAATRFTPGGLQMQLNGAPGTNVVVIEASADLIHWQPILTNTPVNGSVQFLDSNAASFPQRFYRAHQPE